MMCNSGLRTSPRKVDNKGLDDLQHMAANPFSRGGESDDPCSPVSSPPEKVFAADRCRS